MTECLKIHLDPDEFSDLQSHYLHDGRKQESWRIGSIDIQNKKLKTTVTMTSIYKSDTDRNGFHLTIFSALEFASELMIIYAHAWAGFKQKSREGWMIESSTRNIRAIRDAEIIDIEMNVATMKKRGDNMICIADYRLTDSHNGLFEIRLKGFLS